MPNVFQRGIRWLTGTGPVERDIENAFNRVVYQYIGGQEASFDYHSRTYLTRGFGKNPDVYSIITQQYKKLITVPYAVRKVRNSKSFRQLNQLDYATKGDLSTRQYIRRK